MSEEAEAIGSYVQRISVEPDVEARAITDDSMGEEFKHFSMKLEFLLRRTPKWRETAEGILFKTGDIVKRGEAAEEATSGLIASGGAADPPRDLHTAIPSAS